MPNPLIKTVMIAMFLATLFVWRLTVIAVVDAYGIPSAILIVAGCYALACYIHRRETVTK